MTKVHALRVATALVWLAGVARPAVATDICPPTADPCVVSTAVNVDPGTVLDLGDRAFEIRSPGKVTVTGGDFVLSARSVRIGAGGRLVGLPDGASPALVILMTTGDVQVDANARILMTSDTVPGRLEIHAGGAIRSDGILQAIGLGGTVDGGLMLLQAQGTIELGGPVSVEGNGEGWGGYLPVRAGGDVVVTGAIDAMGANGGTIELASTTGAVHVVGVTDVSARVYGDAGTFEVTALGDIVLGPVKGKGAGNTTDGGGAGATLVLDSKATVTIVGPIDIEGAGPDGWGGSLEVTAGDGYGQLAAVSAAGNGADGCGGAIAIAAEGNASTRGLDVSGGRCGGGTAEVIAGRHLSVADVIDADGTGTFGGGTATVEAPRVQVSGAIRASGASGAPGGTVWVTACQPVLLDTAELAANGSNGRTVIWSSGRAIVAGDLFAGVANEIILLDPALPPLFLPGFTATPAVTLGVNPNLDPCVTPSICGNGLPEAGEECDDGGTSACDGCSPTCRREGCGNGVAECGEECDAGSANGTPGSACSVTCTETAPASRIAGGGTPVTDCAFQWALAHAQPARDAMGHVTARQRCVDGDPGCDFDPTPGSCRFKLWPCVGAANASAGCAASAVTQLELRKPTDRDKPPSGPLRPALLAGLAALPVPAGPGETCGERIELDVPTGKKKVAIQVRAHRGGLAPDSDGLKLMCAAP